MEYKNTLNLPKTDFPMKADLPKREPLLLERWKGEDIYQLIVKKSEGSPRYVLHDGPPYANGNIHIGHALNKTLKDIVVKYKTMRGYFSPYVPGWDCHGLPIEHALFKELKINKSQISQVEFRKKAHEYAMKFVDTQREQFKRLGVTGDWPNPYLTLTPEYEVGILNSFKLLREKGYIYRGLKPVNWCFRCETALAEAEVEYEDHSSPSIFVRFKLADAGKFGKDAYLVIWTTTPWTLMANVAVAVHPNFTYHCIKTDKGDLIVGDKDLFPDLLSRLGITDPVVTSTMPGKELEGLTYQHPFLERKGKVVLADYVAAGDGTGLVHTAPGHGNEDYVTGVKYKLETVMPVDARGRYDESVPEQFRKMNVLEANKAILEMMQESKALLWAGQLQHSYPHCWRCKNPIIFRATNQWFLNLDHEDLRKKLVEAIEKEVVWVPAAGKERIKAMVQLRPDWCLSRQRYWGVPIPALICKKCGHEDIYLSVVDKFIGAVAKEGTDSWFIRDVKDFIPEGLKCPKCGHTDFQPGSDILDVWFDSGVSHQAVLKNRKELGGVPCDLYLEGSDQHRGWFQASLIPGICIEGKPPFKSVLTHGFVVDGEGRKMSKSLGNVIAPDEIIKNYGADILRLWVASSDYNEDIRISPLILTRLAEAYRKIRNTARFILSNLYDFDPDADKVEHKDLKKIDKWILSSINSRLLEPAEKAYEGFEFYKAYQAVYDFCNIELSSLYLDMAKGRLYTYAAKSVERKAAQTAMHAALSALVRAMAPILVFTAEEIWQCMLKAKAERAIASVHLAAWPAEADILPEEGLKEIFALIPEVTKVLEEKRSAGLIGSSFDAKIKLLTNNEIRYNYLSALRQDLPEIFKVSQVEVEKREGPAGIEVSKADGIKCERCWNYSHSVGADKDHPLICDRCCRAITGK
ncbi:MAG: isoleucine--tRNA ligase [Candidatus Omnitrophota bacterium]